MNNYLTLDMLILFLTKQYFSSIIRNNLHQILSDKGVLI